MSGKTDGLNEELQKLIADIELLSRTALGELRGQTRDETSDLHASLAGLLSKASEVKDALVQKVQNADRRVHDNAWTSVGISALVAFLAGVVVGHQQHQQRQPPAGTP
ncbi:MAG TPA: hypothetical protein VMB48_04895 [Steroidobacteraceae bacterium]|nr:hypothetical protein [Steroidobacteraceae bacterium]